GVVVVGTTYWIGLGDFLDRGGGLGGHGTNWTFDILSWLPSRVIVTISLKGRGSCFAPAALVTSDSDATSTTAESFVIESKSTAAALTTPCSTTSESFTTFTKSSAIFWKSLL